MSAPVLAKGQGRKPVDLAALERYGNQDEIWAAIRAFKSKTFTANDLTHWLAKNSYKVNDDTVKSYLVRLARGGYVSSDVMPTGKGCLNIAYYKLINDCGHEAPKLKKTGEESLQGRGNEQMWRTMKILSVFDAQELAINASTEQVIIKLNTAKAYVRSLHKAGYLVLVKPSKPGTQARYRFIASKNTGPKPPQIQRTSRVFDANLKKVVWEGEP